MTGEEMGSGYNRGGRCRSLNNQNSMPSITSLHYSLQYASTKCSEFLSSIRRKSLLYIQAISLSSFSSLSFFISYLCFLLYPHLSLDMKWPNLFAPCSTPWILQTTLSYALHSLQDSHFSFNHAVIFSLFSFSLSSVHPSFPVFFHHE